MAVRSTCARASALEIGNVIHSSAKIHDPACQPKISSATANVPIAEIRAAIFRNVAIEAVKADPNLAPEKTIRFGLQSWEEMMVGFVSYVWERPETAAELAKDPPKQSDLFFDRLDVNGDDFADIITGTGVGGGSRVEVFDGKTGDQIMNFFAFGPSVRTGVRVGAVLVRLFFFRIP